MLTVRFSSNNRVVDTGFNATWKAVNPTDISKSHTARVHIIHVYKTNFSIIRSLLSTLDVVGCGGDFTGKQGELVSPNWPDNYPNQIACTWSISSPSAKNLHIVFTHFEVQAVNILGNCVDFVEVFDAAGKSQG